jgi:septal ring factor EnvC (AmiA/AmiB activator)
MMIRMIFAATSKRELMDRLSEVQKEAEKAKLMNQTCSKLSDQIKTLEAEHQAVSDELNRYQTRNDQLIKQNKVTHNLTNRSSVEQCLVP